ncbi:MAG: hypothetical protein Ta2D_06140 [Rickettsiales bacterium]|nr:MAG: hypothetical protein Ta2D_06140 [Rickettsiales bacterium]
MLNDLELEQLENKYLEKFYHFLKFAEDEMLNGFQTKEKIKNDWIGYWNSATSDFDVGAERIVYALFNGKGIGQPNSCPVGSDLFFEVDDAFIHIDLKTVQTRNIGDYNTSIFVGENQNSYNGDMIVNGTEKREYEPHLPHYYTCGSVKKPCLTYFVTILYEDTNLDILNINLLCMPNGQLKNIYKENVLKAGKNPGKTRFNFFKCDKFELLDNKYRIKIIYMNDKILTDDELNKKLKFLLEIYDKQK